MKKKRLRLKRKPSLEMANYILLKEELELQTAIAELQIARLNLKRIRQSDRLQRLIRKRDGSRSYVV